MLCETVENLIPQLLFNELNETESANVQEHLASCENCKKNYQELAIATGLLQDALHADEPVLPDLKRAELLSAFKELETKNTPVKTNDIFPIPKKPENHLKVFFVCAAAFLLILIGLKMLIDETSKKYRAAPLSASSDVKVLKDSGLKHQISSVTEGKENNKNSFNIKEDVSEKIVLELELHDQVYSDYDHPSGSISNTSDDKDKGVVRSPKALDGQAFQVMQGGKKRDSNGKYAFTQKEDNETTSNIYGSENTNNSNNIIPLGENNIKTEVDDDLSIEDSVKNRKPRTRIGHNSKPIPSDVTLPPFSEPFQQITNDSNKGNQFRRDIFRQKEPATEKVKGEFDSKDTNNIADLPKKEQLNKSIDKQSWAFRNFDEQIFGENSQNTIDKLTPKPINDFFIIDYSKKLQDDKEITSERKREQQLPVQADLSVKDQVYSDLVGTKTIKLGKELNNLPKEELGTKYKTNDASSPMYSDTWEITLDSRVAMPLGVSSTNSSNSGVNLSNVRYTDGNTVSSDAVLSFSNGTDVTVSATASNNQVNNDTSKTTVAESRENQKAEVTGFTCSMHDAYSTFSMDAGSASYDLSRQIIATGRMPAPGVVRPEEFVNAFDYQYVNNTNRTFSIITDCMPNPFKNDMHILRVGIKGKVLGRDGRKPLHLIFVIDTSGSMGKDNRLPYVKKGLVQMMSKLQLNDRISLVTYGSEARVQLEYIAVDNRQTILSAIDSLKSAGPTHLSQGVSTGYELAKNHFNAKASNQVILCSDGVANIGDTDGDLLLEQVVKNKKLGISFSCVGFGSGDYNDKLIEKLSHSGDGFYYYVNSEADLKKVFVDDIGSGFKLIARDAKIQIEFDPASVYRYRLIGYEKRMLAAADFRNDEVDGGEIESGRSVTAFYEIELVKADKGAKASASLGKVNIRYQNIDSGDFEEDYAAITSKTAEVFAINDNPYFYLGFSAVLFSEILRASPYINTDDIDKVEGYVSTLNSVLPQNMQIKDFLNIIKVYQKNRPR